ncbi:MAG: hypothetical protein LBV50_11125, partial [Novosphingobium sp.]|nr:hypothetical protein [Novosphingobium sp.]
LEVPFRLYTTGTTMTGANPSGHNAPCSNRDFDFFYKGLEDGQLLAQQCQTCSTLRSLPSPGSSRR